MFVSHSHEDTWVARQIARHISDAGAVVFLDEANVQVGGDFEQIIRDFLLRAHEVVALVTPWSIKRPYVWSELGAAWLRGIPIIVVLHGVSTRDFQKADIPGYVKQRDIIRLNEIDVYFGQLAQRVRLEEK